MSILVNLLKLSVLVYFIVIFTSTFNINLMTKEVSMKNIQKLHDNKVINMTSILIDEYNSRVYYYIQDHNKIYTTKMSTRNNIEEKLSSIFGNDVNIIYGSESSMVTKIVYMFIYLYIIYKIMTILILDVVMYIFTRYYIKKEMNEDKKSDDDDTEEESSFSLCGRSPQKKIFNIIKKGEINIKETDVIGQKEAKEDLKQIKDYFKNIEKYKTSGYKIPKGIIFNGEPGTGKTLLAKAFAGEAGVTFISAQGSQFMEIYVGVGALRIREMFKYARKHSPSIIFIDEIDTIGKDRREMSNGSSENSSTLNELLTQMDGFNENEDIMVIAATNMVEKLDSALTRSGRFDKEIIFDLPNFDERKELFKLFLKNAKMNNTFEKELDTKLNTLAKITSRLNGADIKNIVNQGIGLFLQRLEMTKITDVSELEDGVDLIDLTSAIDIVSIGMEKTERKTSENEKKIVAYHESGHTLIAYILEKANIPVKVSIIPRGRAALGYSQQESNDDYLYSKSKIYAEICVFLGGRCAEQIFLSNDMITNGASDDIKRATSLAYNYISTFGMDEEIGPINFYDNDKLSDHFKSKVDHKVQTIMHKCHEKVLELLKTHKSNLEKLADKLYEKEVLNEEEIEEILGHEIKNSVTKLSESL